MKALYRKVSDEILEKIATGRLKVGDRLPPESEFASELGVSRSTVRLAFNTLESRGVLRRRKRVGTEIIAAEPQLKFNIGESSKEELLNLTGDLTFVVHDVSFVRSEGIDLLLPHHDSCSHWLAIYGSRTDKNDTRPSMLSMVYVPEQFAGIESTLNSVNSSVFKLIEETYAVSVGRVTRTITAVGCTEKEAEMMGLEVGEPVTHFVVTLYSQSGELIEVAIGVGDPAKLLVQTDVTIE